MLPSNAGSKEPASSISLSAAELRGSQSAQSPTLGSEGVLGIILQTAELLLIIGVAGAQGSILLSLWRGAQEASASQESRGTLKHKVYPSHLITA